MRKLRPWEDLQGREGNDVASHPDPCRFQWTGSIQVSF